jgi:chromosome segregation protein
MQLKRLEVVGFKSFGNKAVFRFDAPITSIVGPNGSGKSNVVESIRFVLGEQSMKSLRGGSTSDLIFKSPNGRTMQRAAVSLVFDNRNRNFQLQSGSATIDVDFDEIELMREVYGDGSSSYRINGTVVRLRDILELIGSVNIGPSGHHIISQGEADRLLTASLRDRKAMLEEALGLKVYQYRIAESQRKLDKSRCLLYTSDAADDM